MLGKGLLLLGGTLAVGSMISTGPVLTVTAPLFWWGAKSYKVGSAAAAGVAMALSMGVASGKIAGATGTSLVIQGVDQMSQQLVDRLNRDKDAPEES